MVLAALAATGFLTKDLRFGETKGQSKKTEREWQKILNGRRRKKRC